MLKQPRAASHLPLRGCPSWRAFLSTIIKPPQKRRGFIAHSLELIARDPKPPLFRGRLGGGFYSSSCFIQLELFQPWRLDHASEPFTSLSLFTGTDTANMFSVQRLATRVLGVIYAFFIILYLLYNSRVNSSDYFTMNFLPFWMQIPPLATFTTRRPLRSKIGALAFSFTTVSMPVASSPPKQSFTALRLASSSR